MEYVILSLITIWLTYRFIQITKSSDIYSKKKVWLGIVSFICMYTYIVFYANEYLVDIWVLYWLFTISIVDLKTMMIDKKLLFIGLSLVLCITLYRTIQTGYLMYYTEVVVNMFFASFILLGLGLVTTGKVGGGDYKVFAIIGGLTTGIDANIVLFLSTSITLIVLIFTAFVQRHKKINRVPFIPFVFLGYAIYLLYRQDIYITIEKLFI